MKFRALCLIVLLGLCARPAAAVPLVSVGPSTVVAPGDSFFLDINIGDVKDLFGFQFDLFYDPAVVSANDIVGGTFLSSTGEDFFIPGLIDNLAGTIAFTANTLLGPIAGVSGSGTLARLNLTAKAAGSSVVGLANLLLLDSSLSEISAGTQNATVTVTTVPEPGTIVLLATGLGAAWLGRRRLAGAV
jgi:hypothetical protein